MRRAEGAYLAEGVRLVREALNSGQPASLALFDPASLSRSDAGARLMHELPGWAERWYQVDDRVLRAAAGTEHPAGVLVVLRRVDPEPLASHSGDRFGLLLDTLGDPGNAGTILRTAAAAGVGYVAAMPGSVDLYAPKVVRAAMGAHFRLPLYDRLGWADLAGVLLTTVLVGTDMRAGFSIYQYRWPDRACLVVGSEAHGLSPEARERVQDWVHIPMQAGVESLNAAVAASIVIYAALGPSIPT